MATHVQNYTLGRAEVFFDRFAAGTLNRTGRRYFGNTPAVSITNEVETLDHFSSDRGTREKDASVVLQTNRSGQLTVDDISAENLALYFFGTTLAIADAGGAVVAEALGPVQKDRYYGLGIGPSTPACIRGISPTGFAVKNGGT